MADRRYSGEGEAVLVDAVAPHIYLYIASLKYRCTLDTAQPFDFTIDTDPVK